jgi:5'-nucleotidase
MEHDMFRTMPLIEGAADALWRLSDAGIWIRIITHRLYVHWGHEKAVGDTAAWLDANRIPYRDLCFLGAKPQVEADVYIDDAPHNIEQLRAAGNTVITFTQPYNRSLEGEPRAANWAEVEAIVTDSPPSGWAASRCSSPASTPAPTASTAVAATCLTPRVPRP